MKKMNTVIIGAGISGLTFANFYDEPVLLIEGENEVGGLCRTIYKDDYIWDYSGHFFHFAKEEFRSYFQDKILRKDIIQCQKNTKIYYDNLLIEYPFQINIHQLPQNEFIDCLYDLFNKEEKVKYENFEEMLYGKFGKSITEKFLKPYNEKLYACDLNELDTDAMGRFFPYADIKDVINNMKKSRDCTYNSIFEYPTKGAMTFVNALLQEVDLNNVLLDTQVQRIDISNKVIYTSKGVIQYERLINTISLKNLIKMIQRIPAQYNIKSLHSNKVLVFNMGFDKKSSIDDVHWIYFPNKTINFYRVGFYDNILKGDKLSIYVEIGYDENEEINIEEQKALTLENLKKCGIISDHKLCQYEAIIMNPAYVHVTNESRSMVLELKEYLKQHDVYTIGRYGSWTYCSIEDCMIEAKRLAEELNGI